jgi:hypothetical protein
MWSSFPFLHPYLGPIPLDSSFCLDHSDTYASFFPRPTHLFLCFPLTMANTCNQYLENRIATHIESKVDHLKEELKKDINSHLSSQLESHLKSQIDSFFAKILEKMPIFGIHSSYDQPSNIKVIASSNSHQFQSNPFHHDLCLP